MVRNALDANGFADVVTKSSQREEVRDYIADQATLRLAKSSNFVSAARPVVADAISEAIATGPVREAVYDFAAGAHDQIFRISTSSRANVSSAQAAVTVRAALDAIKRARAATVGGGEPVKWEKAASLSALMKAVPLVHTGLKRGVEPNRLARQAGQTAGQSAALAAIAQVSMLDPEPARSPAEVQEWVQMCIQMRDASGEVNSAVHAQDQAQVVTGGNVDGRMFDARQRDGRRGRRIHLGRRRFVRPRTAADREHRDQERPSRWEQTRHGGHRRGMGRQTRTAAVHAMTVETIMPTVILRSTAPKIRRKTRALVCLRRFSRFR